MELVLESDSDAFIRRLRHLSSE